MANMTPLNHIAIIPDGNRRWAKQHNKLPFQGHQKGAEVMVRLLRHIRKSSIHTATVWGMSSENLWNRPKEEVEFLVTMFGELIKQYSKDAAEDHVRFKHIGSKERLPQKLLDIIAEAEDKTRQYTDFCLNVAIDYGGQDEVLRAIQKASKIEDMSNITSETFEKYLDTAGEAYPHPDLVIRTSGEKRTSGLMIWQAAYAEWLFLEKYFPDMTEEDIDQAIENFNSRQRRFGK